jgi:N-acetylmuramoyl-L-alanine amidase
VRERERCERGERQPAADVGPEHDDAAVEAVADRSAGKQANDRRNRHRDSEYGEGGRRVPQVVCDPGHGDQEDPVADQRDGHTYPESPEIA